MTSKPTTSAPIRARTARQQIGDAGEERALAFLLARGCLVVERNASARVGEIDLIVRDGQELVFAEVRVRADDRFGGAAASVGWAKQTRIRRAAQLYLQRHFAAGAWPACRFDVIAIESHELNWIKNAF